jgi:deoxyribose-phosphate aldolase
MDRTILAAMIDHTILGANITEEEVIRVCREAKENRFASVCTEPYFIPLVAKELEGSPVKVCTVIGFPLGNTSTESKVREAEQAVSEGAEELDMVINISALKSGQLEYVLNDIKAVVETRKTVTHEVIVKVIIETCYLTDEEKVMACQLSRDAGAAFVKTSTGFGTGGATVEDVRLMRQTVGKALSVKASGGIRSYQDALAMIEAGADRIGASSGLKIISEAE